MKPVYAVLFDFDGTFSTLRDGWEKIMQPLMLEYLGADCEALIVDYIAESTGIQTIHQMKWLAEKASAIRGIADDPWEYKAEYNRRLMKSVTERRRKVLDGSLSPEEFMIKGSKALLEMLAESGVALYVASGTDDADVKQEVAVLGLEKYFAEIKGAPEAREDCSKEAVIRALIEDKGVAGDRLAVVGDGIVEIAIGKENGARTLGLATDEIKRFGINPVKRKRLINAGADAITGDFDDIKTMREFFMGERSL
jgi:phosphoglycolate phosphatase-like HAD superfamily hydrolase